MSRQFVSTNKLNSEKEFETEKKIGDYLVLAAVRYIGTWFASAMGACASRNSAVMSTVMDGTAKVVLPDGGLLEYAHPATAGTVLGKEAAGFFVCDADDMEIGGFVSAVNVGEELCLGQLYFVLPRSMLSYPLRAEDLAALAVKASAALVDAAGRRGRRRAVAPLVFPVDITYRKRFEKENREQLRRRSPRDGRRRGPKFSPELVGIPE